MGVSLDLSTLETKTRSSSKLEMYAGVYLVKSEEYMHRISTLVEVCLDALRLKLFALLDGSIELAQH